MVALVLVISCMCGITAFAGQADHAHTFIHIGATAVGNWDTTHYVTGPNGPEVCTIHHEVMRHYYKCSSCGYQFTQDTESQYHSNVHCPLH